MVMIPRPKKDRLTRAEWDRLWGDWQPAPLLQESEDWRLTTARDLAGVTLRWAGWHRPSQEWDHDHCAGCFVKFMEEDFPDVLHEGWTTRDDWPWGPEAEWVCPECFEDLKPILGWKAEEGSGDLSGPSPN